MEWRGQWVSFLRPTEFVVRPPVEESCCSPSLDGLSFGGEEHGASEPLWMPLLGAWLAVERISQSTVHCYCKKRKQASRRGGFYWGVTAAFSNATAG